MDNLVKVSVIIPVFNKEQYIISTLESVLKQIYKEVEIIIIDDGSTDDSLTIIREYITQINSKKIKLFTQKNVGVSKTRNRGIDISSGEYICFLDADDKMKENFLSTLITEKNIKCQYDILCSTYFTQDRKGNMHVKSNLGHSKKFVKNYLMGKNSIHTSNWLIRKKLIIENDIRFDNELSWGEDMLFFSRIALLTEHIFIINKPLTIYNIGIEDSLSKGGFAKISGDILWVEKLINYIRNSQKINKIKKKEVIDALITYRLPALIVYRLLDYINILDEDNYLEQKENLNIYISKFRFTNGLRSLKLFFNILKFKKKAGKLPYIKDRGQI